MMRAGAQLVPQRLGIDCQALAGHHPDLSFERQMIGVLRDGHRDAKCRRIAAARQDLRGAGRRHHRAVAPASIFLPHVVLDLIGELDGSDPIGCFHLTGHFQQLAATRGALPIIDGQFVPNLDDRESRLPPRAMTLLRRPRR